MSSPFLKLAAATMFVGVAMGAFGAHGLKHLLTPEMLEVYKTGVSYQMWHGLGLGLIALVHQQSPQQRGLHWAGWLMFIGIILFSGSLYLLTIFDLKWLGIITPFGGTAFLAAWGLLLFACYKK